MIRTSVLIALLIALATATASAAGERAAGTLQVRGGFDTTWRQVACPAGAPSSSSRCFAIKGQTVVRGLGKATEAATYVIDDATADPSLFHLTAGIAVAGKGEIDVSAVSHTPICPCSTSPVAFDYQVTGGTGVYRGAEGSGTVVDTLRANSATGGVGNDAWAGSLTVPGYAFDTTPPAIAGAVAKSVKAPAGTKRARVRYEVTAHDAGAGPVTLSCMPRSGSLFRIGRTVVSCTATDASGNPAHARFTITVRR
jgi:hypothetical protein